MAFTLLTLVLVAQPSAETQVQAVLDANSDFISLCAPEGRSEPITLELSITTDGKLEPPVLVKGKPTDWPCVEFSLYAGRYPAFSKRTTVTLDYVVGPDPVRKARRHERALRQNQAFARALMQAFPNSANGVECVIIQGQSHYRCRQGNTVRRVRKPVVKP